MTAHEGAELWAWGAPCNEPYSCPNPWSPKLSCMLSRTAMSSVCASVHAHRRLRGGQTCAWRRANRRCCVADAAHLRRVRRAVETRWQRVEPPPLSGTCEARSPPHRVSAFHLLAQSALPAPRAPGLEGGGNGTCSYSAPSFTPSQALVPEGRWPRRLTLRHTLHAAHSVRVITPSHLAVGEAPSDVAPIERAATLLIKAMPNDAKPSPTTMSWSRC
jgi:hypothetical protein